MVSPSMAGADKPQDKKNSARSLGHQTNPPPAANQRDRLSDALRANLLRRKEQARDRDKADAPARPTLIDSKRKTLS